MTRRQLLAAFAAAPGVTYYVRFRKGGKTAMGIWTNDEVRECTGALLTGLKPTSTVHKLKDVQLLAPLDPPKVIAIARNYKSHIGGAPAPSRPEMFFKPTSCLTGPEAPIVLPPDSTDVHYEGELVVVIGKRLHNASKDEAKAAVLGVTCGNDVSERQWQSGPDKDIQWWRAKGSDTFGPLGPAVAVGLDYTKSTLRTRLNGKVVQEQPIADLIYDVPTMLAFTSKYVALNPGDIVFTGTPNVTKKMTAGDVVEVDIDGVGVLRNPVIKG